FSLPALELHPFAVEGDTAKLDLALSLSTDETITGALSYNTDLFDAAGMERLVAHFQALATGVVESSSARISELPLMSARERHQLLVEWGDGQGSSATRPVHELFEEQACRTPNAPAVISLEGQLSYRQLDSRASRFAARLRSRGVTLGSRVALMVDRGAEMIVALLGILKAGGTYVPLDPSHPQERLEHMIADSQAQLLVS